MPPLIKTRLQQALEAQQAHKAAGGRSVGDPVGGSAAESDPGASAIAPSTSTSAAPESTRPSQEGGGDSPKPAPPPSGESQKTEPNERHPMLSEARQFRVMVEAELPKMRGKDRLLRNADLVRLTAALREHAQAYLSQEKPLGEPHVAVGWWLVWLHNLIEHDHYRVEDKPALEAEAIDDYWKWTARAAKLGETSPAHNNSPWAAGRLWGLLQLLERRAENGDTVQPWLDQLIKTPEFQTWNEGGRARAHKLEFDPLFRQWKQARDESRRDGITDIQRAALEDQAKRHAQRALIAGRACLLADWGAGIRTNYNRGIRAYLNLAEVKSQEDLRREIQAPDSGA